MFENRMDVVREEDVYIERHIVSFEIDQRFDPAGKNQ